MYKSSLIQDCYSLQSCNIRHFLNWWESQNNNNHIEGNPPVCMTPDLQYYLSHQPVPTPHIHLASSSAFAFIFPHPQPFFSRL